MRPRTARPSSPRRCASSPAARRCTPCPSPPQQDRGRGGRPRRPPAPRPSPRRPPSAPHRASRSSSAASARMFFGRRAPFSAACLETNSARTMLPACGSADDLGEIFALDPQRRVDRQLRALVHRRQQRDRRVHIVVGRLGRHCVRPDERSGRSAGTIAPDAAGELEALFVPWRDRLRDWRAPMPSRGRRPGRPAQARAPP